MGWYVPTLDGRHGEHRDDADALLKAWGKGLTIVGPHATALLHTRARDVEEALATWDAQMHATARQAGIDPPVLGGWTIKRRSCWGWGGAVIGTAHQTFNQR